MRTIIVRSITITSLTLALGLLACEKQPTAPPDGDNPVEDPTADSGGEPTEEPKEEPKEGGW